jgi:anti-sigma-K factor RskA
MIDPNDIDGMAAEYALGTLDRADREAVASARVTDTILDQAVVDWERRLSPMIETAPEVAPPGNLYSKIEKRIFGSASQQAVIKPWRSFAMAASLAFVLIAGAALYEKVAVNSTPQFVAILEKDHGGPNIMVSFNEKDLTLTVRSTAASAPANKSYELWLVADGSAPKSLGVLSAEDSKSIILNNLSPTTIRNSTMAISLEPSGGSPTGAPTGPVILTGKFAPVTL